MGLTLQSVGPYFCVIAPTPFYLLPSVLIVLLVPVTQALSARNAAVTCMGEL